MILKESIRCIFVELSDALQQLTDEQYATPSGVLSGASIGQHTRHIIELFRCLENGYAEGRVNYDKRARDRAIETNKNLAILLFNEIPGQVDKPDKALVLETDQQEAPGSMLCIKTNYYREIIYNMEHTIHHMALIRIGIHEVTAVELPETFGVARSTIKYRSHVHRNIYPG